MRAKLAAIALPEEIIVFDAGGHDDAVSLLEENALREDEPSLRGDEHSDDMHSLLEEDARLRGVIGQLSSIILRNAAGPK